MFRIELYERYILNAEKDEDYWRNLGVNPEYGYRRTMPFIDQIERPIEIVGNKKECIVQFWGGEQIVIKECYDDFCIRLNDIELQLFTDEELPE